LAISDKTAHTIFIKFEYDIVRKIFRYLVYETKIWLRGLEDITR